MKSLLRSFLINAGSLWVVSQILAGGISFTRGYETLALAAIVLGIINLFIRPLLNILLLPINLLTLGTFRWLVNVAALFLVTLLVPEFKIAAFYFQGFTFQGFTLPAAFIGTAWAFLLVSFLLSSTSGLLYWIIK